MKNVFDEYILLYTNYVYTVLYIFSIFRIHNNEIHFYVASLRVRTEKYNKYKLYTI